MITAAVLVIFPLCMAMAACNDLLTMTIPNRLSIILVVAFLCVSPLAGLDLMEIGMHLGAGLVVFACGFGLFALRIMGGGDAKILAASAIWFGWNPSLIAYFVYVAELGGALSIVVLMLRANSNLIAVARLPVPQTMLHAKKVPYGVAIGIAAFIAFPASPLFKLAVGVL
jgi:prepilin peptidase CpaA